ncbi:MAG TPA: M28 family peptidase [Bryobacteraceae bacterium]|nr:M28 family peptidase [Bryobacteraceae bacterium]
MRLLLMTGGFFAGFAWPQSDPANDPIKTLVGRLDLQSYKATIQALTKFGDRREGTDRNRAAVDWIEAQLKSYGCTNTERIHYEDVKPATLPPRLQFPAAPGGGVIKGELGTRGMLDNDPDVQPDARLRQLNMQPSTPGPREEVFCTKIGATHPEEMYIVGAHMDGKGWGEAANDDASGTALVMEIARILSAPEVSTERSIRFALWNNEETGPGTYGSEAYVVQRKDLQGKEDPPGSGYPEPRWLGMITHDMMLFDHGMPRKDGTVSEQQRPEADVNIEFQSRSKFAAQSAELAWAFRDANEKYATDYPAQVGNHWTNTDSLPFQDLTPAISLRELEPDRRSGRVGTRRTISRLTSFPIFPMAIFASG